MAKPWRMWWYTRLLYAATRGYTTPGPLGHPLLQERAWVYAL